LPAVLKFFGVNAIRGREAEMNNTPHTSESDGKLMESVNCQLAFQRKWQRLSMLAYVLSTIGILFCSTLGTLAAARTWNELAAYLAAIATILVSVEKTMLFREKWKFHLAIATRLSVLLSHIEIGAFPEDKSLDEYSSILKQYADSLPIAARESN
jgi:hypothetical protein